MGNELQEMTITDIQKQEIQHRPLNNLSPLNYTTKSIHKISPQNAPANTSIDVKRKSIIIDSSSLALSPIDSDPSPPLISAKTVQCAADFWIKNVESLSLELRLEIGWSIYIGMLATNYRIQELFDAKCESIKQIEATSLKFLDMIGFLIRGIRNQSNSEFITKSLHSLGSLHSKIGVTLEHYGTMILQMHQTFEIYFHPTYHTQIRWCVHKVLSYCVRMMTDEDLHMPQEEASNEGLFSQSLDVCLKTNVGRRKLFRYLQEYEDNEIVIFMHLFSKFKLSTHSQTRYMIARYIVKSCVNGESIKNIASQKNKMMNELADYQLNCHKHNDFMLTTECLNQMEAKIHELIIQKHWIQFKKSNVNKM